MTVGIICEFDPLHLGHAHLLAQARAMMQRARAHDQG